MPLQTLVSAYASRRMVGLLGLGFAAGLPLMLTGRTLSVWARDQGVNLTTIGLFSLVTLPYSMKFIWAPVMDRFMPPILGRRCGWILLMQLALVAAIAAMALLGPEISNAGGDQLWLFAVASLCVAFFSASQDIVADAYRTDVLSAQELGPGASIYMTGYRIAMLASGAGAVYLAEHLAWSVVYMIAGGAMIVGVVSTLLAPEPLERVQPPASFAHAVIEPAREFLVRNRGRAAVVLLFIVAFKLPDYMAGRMIDPLLLDLGFTKEDISFWALGVGFAMSIPGLLIGGPIVARLGLVRALVLFGIAQALSNFGYLILASAGQIHWLMITVIAVEYFCMGLVAAGFVAFLMGECNKRYSATQFALLSSLMGLSSALAGTPTGFLVEQLDYTTFFLLTVLAALPGMAMLPWLRPAGRAREHLAAPHPLAA